MLEHVLVGHTLLMSLELAAEATDVMRREKFDRYIAKPRREALLAGTIHVSEFVHTVTTISVCRDPDDNRLLELAIDGKATAIITGDADLLALKSVSANHDSQSTRFPDRGESPKTLPNSREDTQIAYLAGLRGILK